MGSPFKMNPKTPLMKALVGKQGNLPQQLKQAILDAPAKMTDKDKKKGTKKDTFRYESDAPEVIGTAYTKSGTERVTEYKKGGKELKKGDTYDYGGFQTPKKVVDTGRDTRGNKLSGRTGTVDVEVKKGDIRFTTGKKTKEKTGAGKSPAKMIGGKNTTKHKQANSGIGPKPKIEKGKNTTPKLKQTKAESSKNYRTGVKSPAKSYGKSPMKKTEKPLSAAEIKKNKETLDYRRGKGRIKESGGAIEAKGISKGKGLQGEARVAGSAGTRGVKKDYTASGRSMGTSGRVVKEKTASAIKPRGVDTGKKKSIGKSPAKMQGGKKGRPGTGVIKESRPLTPSQKANVNAQNKRANANAKRTGRGTGLIKDPTMRTKNKK